MAPISLILTYAIVSAIAAYVVIWKFGVRVMATILWMDAIVDLLFSMVLFMAFQGTFSGLLTAVIGGLVFSVLLIGTKYFVAPQPPLFLVNIGESMKSTIRFITFRRVYGT